VLPAIQPLPGNVTLTEDPERQQGRGYYERGRSSSTSTTWS
jgi:hypothetical protein